MDLSPFLSALFFSFTIAFRSVQVYCLFQGADQSHLKNKNSLSKYLQVSLVVKISALQPNVMVVLLLKLEKLQLSSITSL